MKIFREDGTGREITKTEEKLCLLRKRKRREKEERQYLPLSSLPLFPFFRIDYQVDFSLLLLSSFSAALKSIFLLPSFPSFFSPPPSSPAGCSVITQFTSKSQQEERSFFLLLLLVLLSSLSCSLPLGIGFSVRGLLHR